MWMPLWICLQEKAHVAGEIYQRRELSAARAAFFFVDGGGSVTSVVSVVSVTSVRKI